MLLQKRVESTKIMFHFMYNVYDNDLVFLTTHFVLYSFKYRTHHMLRGSFVINILLTIMLSVCMHIYT